MSYSVVAPHDLTEHSKIALTTMVEGIANRNQSKGTRQELIVDE